MQLNKLKSNGNQVRTRQSERSGKWERSAQKIG